MPSRGFGRQRWKVLIPATNVMRLRRLRPPPERGA